MTIPRQLLVICHRWAGLTIALFLTVAGFTGIFLAWIDEIEVALSPQLHLVAPPHPGVQPISPLVLRQQVLDRYPAAEIDYLPLTIEPGRSVHLHVHWHDPQTGKPLVDEPQWDDLFVDPYTGRELGNRQWGNIGEGRVNLMPFVYRLHYSLALGEWGTLAFGIAALLWTLDCFVGFALTLPVRVKRRQGLVASHAPGWWRRWQPSWRVRWGASPYKISFDLHRAGGLWVWPMLLVFAWSSVSFNLPQVYGPVMQQWGAQDANAKLMSMTLKEPRAHPVMGFDAAAAQGEQLARQEMAQRGLAIRGNGMRYLWHLPSAGAYVYGFTSAADIAEHGGGSRIAFDSNDGTLKAIDLPSGQNSADSVTNWIAAMHMGRVFGLPYRIAVSLIGAMVTMLSVTGVLIWMKKRTARMRRAARA